MEIDITRYQNWLNGKEEKFDKKQVELLEEGDLSRYWHLRAETRSKRAGREFPNAVDENWAELQQESSSELNPDVERAFERQLEETETLQKEVDEILSRTEESRAAQKISANEKVVPFGKGKKLGKGKSLPALKRGKGSGVARGYNQKRRKAKKYGGSTLAPGESFGSATAGAAPMEEDKKK
jgi:hypothetical protein